MTAIALNWLLTIIGTVASIAGFILSWMAWTQAKGAKLAAEEASRLVRTREAAYDFSRMAADAKGLLEAIQTRQREKAVVLATDLTHLLLLARDRRALYIPQGIMFDLCLDNLRRIGTRLATEGFPESNQKLDKLFTQCHQIHNTLCGVAAKVERRSEESES